jgi:predicted PurR-regulated permease PerM
MVFNPNFFNSETTEESQGNLLLQYLQQQRPEIIEQIAQSVTPEVKQIVSQNVQGLVGMLPSDDFEVQVTTNRESIANLLVSAMMTGYFLRQMEQRMELDVTLNDSGYVDR